MEALAPPEGLEDYRTSKVTPQGGRLEPLEPQDEVVDDPGLTDDQKSIFPYWA